MRFTSPSVLALSMLLTVPTAFANAPLCAQAISTSTDKTVVHTLAFDRQIQIGDSKGMTFFSFMKQKVKPTLDAVAHDGFSVADADTVVSALGKVGEKVRRGALKSAGSEDNLRQVVQALQGSTEKVTLYNLPQKIALTGIRADRYSLSTFLALASGGGLAVRIDEKNAYYNVNYGTGATAKDEMTGRSFGEGPKHLADDASDKSYLQELQEYVRTENQDPSAFFRSLFQILTNCDTSGYKQISDAGQTVGSDFFAIYTAEADRHLMSNLRTHAWDVALLEVTMLSAFHSGQSNVKVMFNGILTDTVPKQAPGGEDRTEMKKASMVDWWQFSSNPDPKARNRSGINVTKKDFRALGLAISNEMRTAHPELVSRVEGHLAGVRVGGNVFAEITDFLINAQTSASLTDAPALTEDIVAFLNQVRLDADKMTTAISAQTAH